MDLRLFAYRRGPTDDGWWMPLLDWAVGYEPEHWWNRQLGVIPTFGRCLIAMFSRQVGSAYGLSALFGGTVTCTFAVEINKLPRHTEVLQSSQACLIYLRCVSTERRSG